MPEPLTAEEMARFKREGYSYLIKRNVLDPELCARAREIFWSHNAVPRLDYPSPTPSARSTSTSRTTARRRAPTG